MSRASHTITLLGLLLLNIAAAATQQAGVDPFPHPVLPAESTWPVWLLRGVVVLLVLAVVIGPVVRRHVHEDLPPRAHSHDEPPGTSGLHGKSGTVDLNAPDRSHR